VVVAVVPAQVVVVVAAVVKVQVVVVVVAVVEVQVVVVPVQVVVQAKVCADALSVSYPPGAQVNRSSRRS
jgi:hypothetical protein